MANTVATTYSKRGMEQFGGLWSELWEVTAAWTDQDAIADDVSVLVTITVPGVALGDAVIVKPFMNVSQLSTGRVALDAWVSAANTVSVTLTNVDETTDALAADAFNGKTMKMVIARPSW